MKKILIVDDDFQVRNMLDRFFKAAGFTTVIAADGLEGLEKASQEKPDLVVADIEMPQLDGIGMCSTLKNNPATAHIPFLFLSGDGQIGKVEEALQQGGDGYVTKPFDLPRLMTKVRGLLG